MFDRSFIWQKFAVRTLTGPGAAKVNIEKALTGLLKGPRKEVANADGVTRAAGQKRANRFGLYNMLGNVSEWCWDAYEKDNNKQSPRDDPTGPGAAEAAVQLLRGGSWYHPLRDCRSAYRDRDARGYRSILLSFRVARVQSSR